VWRLFLHDPSVRIDLANNKTKMDWCVFERGLTKGNAWTGPIIRSTARAVAQVPDGGTALFEKPNLPGCIRDRKALGRDDLILYRRGRDVPHLRIIEQDLWIHLIPETLRGRDKNDLRPSYRIRFRKP